MESQRRTSLHRHQKTTEILDQWSGGPRKTPRFVLFQRNVRLSLYTACHFSSITWIQGSFLVCNPLTARNCPRPHSGTNPPRSFVLQNEWRSSLCESDPGGVRALSHDPEKQVDRLIGVTRYQRGFDAPRWSSNPPGLKIAIFTWELNLPGSIFRGILKNIFEG